MDIDRQKATMKITQLVLLQSFKDEFQLPDKAHNTPAEPGQVLHEAKEGEILGDEEQTKYRSGVGKLLHFMRWSRPQIWNAVRELTKHNSRCNETHIKEMKRVMAYCVSTPNRGWRISPLIKINIGDNVQLRIKGASDASYATCKTTRRSVTGFVVFVEGAVVAVKSGMQRIMALSTAEAELIAMIQCVQVMMYVKKLVESLELKVELPMIIKRDNKGAVDLTNGWSVGGHSKHIDVWLNFLRKLIESNIVQIDWEATDEMVSDMHTKNLTYPTFEKQTKRHCGDDEYWCH